MSAATGTWTETVPLYQASESTRINYLKRVLLWTSLSLAGTAAAGIASLLVISMVPALQSMPVYIASFLVGYVLSQFVARGMVTKGGSGALGIAGLGLGSVAMGPALGYLLMTALIASATNLGNPFILVGSSLGLTALTAGGMTAYVWTGPKQFSWLSAGLAAAAIPAFLAMGMSLAFPAMFGGFFGTIVMVAFVAISAGGLLYQINQVFHTLDESQHIMGAYLIAMALFVLFWNLLVLLIRMSGRR